MLGHVLKQLREDKGLYQKQVAEKLGIAVTTYSGYENNSRQPSPEVLCKLADCFHVSVDYLLGRKKTLDESDLSNEILEIANKISKINDSDYMLLSKIIDEMHERNNK